MTLFGFDILTQENEKEPCLVSTLKNNDWKEVYFDSAPWYYSSYQNESSFHRPPPDMLDWFQTQTKFRPIVSFVTVEYSQTYGTPSCGVDMKIWLRPEDYVLFVLKFS